MPEQDSIPVGAILDTWSNDPWTNGLQIDHREDMEKLAVRTWNSLYEVAIIEGRSGEILLRGGQFFPALTPARLNGATLGGSFCKMRGIYVGFRMEINANGQRIITIYEIVEPSRHDARSDPRNSRLHEPGAGAGQNSRQAD